MATPEELAMDQQEKLEKTIQHIIEFCSEDSEHETIRKIAEASKAGGTQVVSGTIISRGATNYSYKIFLESDPSVALFAKVGFSRALWNPDPTAVYDLNRLNCEEQLMLRFQEMMGGRGKAPVATPYGVFDMSEDTRVMIAEWVPADHQWAQQFLDGKVDQRLIPIVAETFASLNTAEVDQSLNEGMKDVFRGLHKMFRTLMMGIAETEEEPKDAAEAYVKNMGKEKIEKIMDAIDKEYDVNEVLLHGDGHVFNILVEPMIDEDTFGEKGELYFCDWEMTHCGSKGRDSGVFISWPILCALFLDAEGKSDRAQKNLDCNRQYWDLYSGFLVSKGAKSEEYLRDTFRITLAWCGYYMFFAWYLLKLPQGAAPVDRLTPENGVKTFGAVGLAGLKYMEVGFLGEQPDLTLEEMLEFYETVIDEQRRFCQSLSNSE